MLPVRTIRQFAWDSHKPPFGGAAAYGGERPRYNAAMIVPQVSAPNFYYYDVLHAVIYGCN